MVVKDVDSVMTCGAALAQMPKDETHFANTVPSSQSHCSHFQTKTGHFFDRDLKHRQRNGTTTTGGSKIFPLKLSAHVRCCQNVVKPSSPTESEKVFRSGENISKELKFYKVIIFYFHLLM